MVYPQLPTHIEDLALLGRGVFERRVDVPRALVVLPSAAGHFSQSSTHKNVRADLANVLGQAVAVQVVVLHLEVLAEGDEDGERELVSSLVGDASLRCQLQSFCGKLR